jgi:hypothetical protein
VVKSILHKDADISMLRESQDTRTIIITPYRAQVCLLSEQFKGVRGVEVATVDSFQGQEADIVILSTVRTKHLGFVDDSQRLNVALTRAKRVLRVVGSVDFFFSLGADSTLKALVMYYQKRSLVSVAQVRSIAWSSPDWDAYTLWKPTMTSKFHHALKDMSTHDRNVCFNTLLAVARPDINLLVPRPPARERPSWYTSSFVGYNHHIYIVWVSKKKESTLIVEAHFAGTRTACTHFIQKHVNPPHGACIVKQDLSGIVSNPEDSSGKPDIKDLITAWPVTNPLQNAIMSGSIESLPQGRLVLDPHQEEIAISKPPLLIESRSGTGKTNVLFQK